MPSWKGASLKFQFRWLNFVTVDGWNPGSTHQLRLVVNPIYLQGFSTIPGGFSRRISEPSTVLQEFSNIPLQHTPDPQPTVYQGILFIWGFELQGYVGVLLEVCLLPCWASLFFESRRDELSQFFVGEKQKNLGGLGSWSSSWRIIPVSKSIVTPIYKPFRPFGRGIPSVRGLTIHGY